MYDFGLLSLPVMAVSMLFGYAIFFDTSAVVFRDIEVPASIEYQGYAPKVMAARLANEVVSIDQKARTAKEFREFELPDDESAVSSLSDYFKFGEPIRAVQQLLGLVEYHFTGDMVKQGDSLHLSVRGYAINKNKSFNEVSIGKDPEELITDMAVKVTRFIDPYIVASYYYETTRDANSNNFDKALEEVRNCLVQLPREDLHWAYNLHGLILLQQDKNDEAIARFNEALQLSPDFVLSVYNIGNAYLAKGDYDQAISYYKTSLQLDSEKHVRTAHAYTRWGVALMRAGQAEDALAKFEQAVESDHNFAESYYWIGMYYKDKGDLETARAMIQRAVDRAPARSQYKQALQQLAAS